MPTIARDLCFVGSGFLAQLATVFFAFGWDALARQVGAFLSCRFFREVTPSPEMELLAFDASTLKQLFPVCKIYLRGLSPRRRPAPNCVPERESEIGVDA